MKSCRSAKEADEKEELIPGEIWGKSCGAPFDSLGSGSQGSRNEAGVPRGTTESSAVFSRP
jgi:hypothetical protein